jgi:hypothetical protein
MTQQPPDGSARIVDGRTTAVDREELADPEPEFGLPNDRILSTLIVTLAWLNNRPKGVVTTKEVQELLHTWQKILGKKNMDFILKVLEEVEKEDQLT